MSKIDVIIFGATGFTGKYVVQECVNLTRMNDPPSFTWAVAGRNADKIADLLQTVSSATGVELHTVPILIADCDNESSLNEMAKRGHVIINCCGPYRFYGEPVVKACIESGTHYVDITGEPEFMEKMQLLYHDEAEANRTYVISSCGMDSVPADLGVIHFMKNFEGQVNYIESYMKIDSNAEGYVGEIFLTLGSGVTTERIGERFPQQESLLTATTWESAVHGYANRKNLIEIRKQLFSKMRKLKPQPPIPRRSAVHYCQLFDNSYSVPFPGSDRSVVVRTQMHLSSYHNLRPVQYNAYLICAFSQTLFALYTIGFFLETFTKYDYGKRLLLSYPGLFTFGLMSRKPPSEQILANTTAVFKFYGEGWSTGVLENFLEPKTITEPTDSYMITEIHLQSPSYGFTATSVVLCALTILREIELLPSRGGVYSPGAAFFKTDILENFEKRGITFNIVRRGNK